MSTETKTPPPTNREEAWDWLIERIDSLSRRVAELELEAKT